MRLELSAPLTVDAGPADQEPRRTISGIAVPYGTTAHASTGRVRFEAGSLDVTARPKLLRDHDHTKPVGIVTELVDTDEGLLFSAKFSATTLADETLALAADGVLDAVSVGVDVTDHEFVEGVMVVKAGIFRELSVLPWGAFPEAKITSVAAEEALEAMPQAGAQTETPADPVDVEETPETADEAAAPSEEDTNMAEATIPTAPLVITAQPRKVTPGQYLSAMLRGEQLPRVEAVAAEDTTADIAGLLPEPLVGDVFNNLSLSDAGPLLTALGTRAMPASGETFYRRKISTHTSAAQQLAEFDELSSTAMVVDRIQVDKKTFGGYVDVSEQAAGWSDPALLGLILEDMARVTRQAFNAYVAAELVGGMGTATSTVTDFTDGDEVIEDLYLAAAEMRANFGAMPTHLLVSTGVWAKLGAAKDSGGNRIFPYLGPSNAAGTAAGVTSVTMNPLGLTLVVDDALIVAPATDAAIVFNARSFEVYEDIRGGVRVDQPATLSTRIAFRTFGATADIDLANGALSLI